MTYPKIIIETNKISKNVSTVVEMARKKGIDIAGVTKGFCAYPEIVKSYINGGVKYLADSRISNLKRLHQFNLPKMLTRIPMISEVEDVVVYSDISLNSEVDTIKALSNAAVKLSTIHNVIIMADLGDLREGYFIEEELFSAVNEIMDLKGIRLAGIGVNLTCYGGVIPKKKILNRLNYINKEINKRFNVDLEIVSGGNSSSIYLLENDELDGITNLRLGESILFGTESAFGNRIDGTFNDAFTLEVEVIEVKEKPSVPTEEIGRDAFGKVPTFVDRGVRKRVLCGIGKQDIDIETIYPYDEELIILGGSSDHLILDASDSATDYKIGDIIRFNIHYVSLLRIMTSEYIEKIIV